MNTFSETEASAEQPVSTSSKVFRILSMGSLFLGCLSIFTLAKLPETKMTNVIQGYLQSALDPMGIYMTDQGREFSVLRGFRYKIIHPTIELSDLTRIELDEITASPKLLSILMLKPGATIELKQGSSTILLDAAAAGGNISATVKLDQANLGKLGLLNYLAQIKGTGIVTGEVNIDGSLADPATLAGKVLLNLKGVQIDEQNLMGFQLETMKVAEGKVDIQIDKGKLVFKKVELGKPNTADDITLQVTGDVALNKNFSSSLLNLRAVLGISERVKQKLTLVDTFMATAKQADGRYAYKLTGPLNSPFPNPDPDKK